MRANIFEHLFEGLDHLSPSNDGQVGESTVTPAAMEKQSPPMMIGSIPISIPTLETDDARTTAQQHGQEQQLCVYSRRRRENVEQRENAEKGEDNNLVKEEPHMQHEDQFCDDSSSSALLDINSNATEGP